MIVWPGPLMIIALTSIAVFVYMTKKARLRHEEQSERLKRHREYYEALMRREKKASEHAEPKDNEEKDETI